jgi:hypothetical protein
MILRPVRRAGGVLLLLALASICAVPAQAQTTLRYKYKAGDKLNYDMEQKMDLKMDIKGKELNVTMNQSIDMTWKVKSVDADGKAALAISFDRIRMMLDGPQGKLEYDSKDGKEPEGALAHAAAPLKAMVGAEFSLKVDPRGKASDVVIPKELIDALKKAGGGVPGVAEMFSPEGLKSLMGKIGVVLPKGPVSNAKLPVALKESTGKGTALFDNNAGRMTQMSITQDMVMSIAGAFTQNIHQTVTMKLRK